MLDTKTYTEEEEKLLNRERRRGIPYEMTLGRKILFLIIMAFTIGNLYAVEFAPTKHSLFPSTWKCKCGYENYEGIASCAICGKPKGAK